MIGNITLPPELEKSIGTENKEFAVLAKRALPLKSSLYFILFGVGWTAFICFFLYSFLGPVLQGKETQIVINDVPRAVSPGNYGALIGPGIVIGIFVLIGIGMFGYGVYLAFKKGGYFVGTPTRLVCFYKGTLKSIDWEIFSGSTEVNGNSQQGNITLQMRTRKIVKRKHSEDYVPDFTYIVGIPNVFEIEQICRKRIKENDPTPSAQQAASQMLK